MYFSKILAAAAVAVTSITGVLAVPASTPTVDPKCPQLYSFTTTETLDEIAPTYTGPYATSTFTFTGTSYPLATTTIREVYTVTSTEWVGIIPKVTESLSTYTAVVVYSNYAANPPYPTDCTVY